LRLRLLELDGRAVAANYSFRVGGCEWSYQHGRDPELEHDSVGFLILAHAIREAFTEGAAEFRLGPGKQEYKLRFADGDHGLETVGLARGLRGRASLLAERRRRRT
jgi:CelD/BcsL family acetyltransferase involved in cellulose biosynthesis